MKLKKRNGEDITIEDFEILYKFLQGEPPEGVKAYNPRLSARKAFSVIWFLQEITGVLPDNIDRCCSCDDLFDSDREGFHVESTGRNYCDGCYRGQR